MFVEQTSSSPPLAAFYWVATTRTLFTDLWVVVRTTKQGYTATHDECRSAVHVVCKLPACHDDDCNTCKVIKATVTQPLLQLYLSSEDAEAKKLPVVCVTADSRKAVGGFTRDVLYVKHFKCFNHIIGNIYLSYLSLYLVIICSNCRYHQ
jgi:hypothetical protein